MPSKNPIRENLKNRIAENKVPIVLLCLLLLIFVIIAVVFTASLSSNVYETTILSIDEIANQEEQAFTLYINANIEGLKGISTSFDAFPPEDEIIYTQYLKIAADSFSPFNGLAALTDTGILYTSDNEIIDSDEFRSYSAAHMKPNGFTAIYDNSRNWNDDENYYLMYAIPTDITTGNVHFTALYGKTPVSHLSPLLSFTNYDGRGCSGIIDKDGWILINPFMISEPSEDKINISDLIASNIITLSAQDASSFLPLADDEKYTTITNNQTGETYVTLITPVYGYDWYLVVCVPVSVQNDLNVPIITLGAVIFTVLCVVIIVFGILLVKSTRQRDTLDMRIKEEHRKAIENDLTTLTRFASDYHSIFKANLATGEMQVFYASGSYADWITETAKCGLSAYIEAYIEKFLRGKDREKFQKASSTENIRKELAGKTSFTIEHRLYLPDGTHRYYQSKFVRLDDANPNLILIGGHDITYMKQLEICMRRDLDIINVIANAYISLYYVNWHKGTVKTFKGKHWVDETDSETGSYTRMMREFIASRVSPDDRLLLEPYTDPRLVLWGMNGEKTFSLRFHMVQEGVEIPCEMLAVRGENDTNHMIVAFRKL